MPVPLAKQLVLSAVVTVWFSFDTPSHSKPAAKNSQYGMCFTDALISSRPFHPLSCDHTFEVKHKDGDLLLHKMPTAEQLATETGTAIKCEDVQYTCCC